MILTERGKEIFRENLSHCHVFHHRSHGVDEIEPGLRVDRPVCNRQRHGMALKKRKLMDIGLSYDRYIASNTASFPEGASCREVAFFVVNIIRNA
jgi:hypothetical protein